MGKIVAIGGGEIAKGETLLIDKFIVSLAKKETPKLLFIPTASSDAQGYIESVSKHFTALNCVVDSLCLVSKNLSYDEIKDKILNTDIIYVGGGNVNTMMEVWQNTGTNNLLKLAYEKGIVLSGLSAGALCWFNRGYSAFLYPNQFLGLSLLNFAHCPHYNEIENHTFDKMLTNQEIGIALEDNTALAKIDGEFSIIKSDNKSRAYIIKNDNGNILKHELLNDNLNKYL